MKFDPFGRFARPSHEDVERKMIVFEIAEMRCGLDIMAVKEIINPGPLVSMPTAVEYFIGTTDHRSSLVPVVDLRRRLCLPPSESQRAKWVIALVAGKDTAFVVDAVKGVFSFCKSDLRERHPLMQGSDISWVKSVYGGAAGLTFELDLDAMLDAAAPRSAEMRP